MSAPEPRPDREPHPKTRAREWPLTAVECERDTLVAPLTYTGIVTSTDRRVCVACLNRDGAVRTLGGERFHHYLWRPARDYGGDVYESDCAACGAAFDHEREAVTV